MRPMTQLATTIEIKIMTMFWNKSKFADQSRMCRSMKIAQQMPATSVITIGISGLSSFSVIITYFIGLLIYLLFHAHSGIGNTKCSSFSDWILGILRNFLYYGIKSEMFFLAVLSFSGLFISSCICIFLFWSKLC